MTALKFSFMGESAVLCEAHDGPLDLAMQRRIWALSEAAERIPGVTETVPGMNNLLIIFDTAVLGHLQLEDVCRQNWTTSLEAGESGRTFDIPVIYGGRHGEDIAACADYAGLSVEEYVERHSGGVYTVFALGSQPGFAYLGGLDASLARPRRETPRPRLEAGSVIIGGAQAGVISRTSPSGWHVIGKTEVQFFDPSKSPPALLLPGDRLRFVVEDINP